MSALTTAQAAGGNVVSSILHLSTDIFVIAGIFAALMAWGIWKGQGGLATFIVSLLVSTTLYKAFPYGSIFSASPFIPIAVFVAIVVAAYFVLSELISVFSFEKSFTGWLKTAMLAVLATALLVGITYHVVSIQPIYSWSGVIAFLFEPATYYFWWLVAAIPILYFI